MKKVAGKEVSKEVSKEAVQENVQQEATKVTYSIEDINQVLGFLSQQKYSEVTGLVELLKTKGELS
jgi:hypothetical protein